MLPLDFPTLCFGNSPEVTNDRAAKVVAGQKTATSWPALPRDEQEDLVPGQRKVVLDGEGKPVALIEVTATMEMSFDEVDETSAVADGYSSLAEWRDFKIRTYGAAGSFRGGMLIKFAQFRVVERLEHYGKGRSN